MHDNDNCIRWYKLFLHKEKKPHLSLKIKIAKQYFMKPFE